MRKLTLFILFLIPLISTAQENLKKIRTSSWQTQAYKVTANDIEKYIKWDSIPVNNFVNVVPYKIFSNQYIDNAVLGIGNFILISTIDNMLQAEIVNNSNLVLLTINNKDRVQIDVRNKIGEFINNATVFVNGKEIKYNRDSKTYWVKQRKLDNATVKIYAPNDTLYSTLALKDELNKSISQQKKRNFKFTKFYKVFNWIPFQLKKIFRKKRKSNNIGAGGYIIFNQPKYKPLDTLKFKAYVIDKKWKQYNKPVELYFNYYNKGKYFKQFIKSFKPVSAGAYIGEIPLADSLPLDTRYTFILNSKLGKKIISNDFKMEEYVLDEIGSYQFKTDKEIYFRSDSMRFFASAKDANGLNLLDGKATLLLTTNTIKQFFKDTVFVKDTLYFNQVKLNTTDDTKFVIAANSLPNAFLEIDATLTFKNANNELHEEHKKIEYNYQSNEIVVTQVDDSIKAVYVENGIEKNIVGELEIDDDSAVNITFPYIAKIDPVVKEYNFSTDKEVNYFEIENNYKVGFSYLSNGDTLGFVLNNPYKIPVYFTVFDGNKIIASAKSNLPQIKWEKSINDSRKVYKVRWQYIWAGEEKNEEESIALFYKKLSIKVDAKETIFPGQKDSIKINVFDYKGKPANNVNLTAVAYNNQFKKDIRVKDPPYLVKYKSKGLLERETFEHEKLLKLIKKYSLGKNVNWISKLSIDTMTYYKLLYPKNGMYDAVTRIDNFVPQVSINLLDKGVPQEIYLLYLNRNLVYYNGVTDKMNYAFDVYPGIAQIGIRTKDKYIEIDSVYIQPNYKHDISFDINQLPKPSRVIDTKKYWTLSEMNLLENSIWQMQNDYKNNNAYLWQYEKLFYLSGNREHIVGPFLRDSLTFYNPNIFDIKFQFEPGYQYNLSNKILRLELKPLFIKKDTSNFLPIYNSTALKLGDTILNTPIIKYELPANRKFLKETDLANVLNYYSSKINGRGRIKFSITKDTVIRYAVLFNLDSNKVALVLSNMYDKINNVLPGNYTLYLITNNFTTATVNNIMVQANGTICLNASTLIFEKNNALIENLTLEAENSIKPKKETKAIENIKQNEIAPVLKIIENGTILISGIIVDEKTNVPIPYCSVRLKGYDYGTKTNINGEFNIKGLTNRKYILEISAVGYQSKIKELELNEEQNVVLKIGLVLSNASLDEVVVTSALGLRRQSKDLVYSTVQVSSSMFNNAPNDLLNGLQGRVSGLNITTTNNGVFEDVKIQLRGIRSLTGNNESLLVVDGIILRQGNLASINPNDIADVIILTGSAATAIYGPDGVNGAIVVTTKNKTERKTFRDYAIWQPNFFTDKYGKASFEVEYPDNITSWNTFIVAMDKKRRIGKMNFLTQAYKPIVTQLNLPQFLIEGDTSYFVGKSMNHTTDTYNIKSEFFVNDQSKNSSQKVLYANDANIEKLLVSSILGENITAKYTLQTTTGFKDAEERKIPVLKKGTEEAVGDFWILRNDTTVTFSGIDGENEINIYAQNNTLDLLLEEIEHLNNYPYACMEQTASKLTGLVMEKKIRAQLNLPFKNQKMFDVLLQKVQKAQLFDGGWPWWENGKANMHITNYVLNALLLHRDNPLVETNIRNGFLYLQNQLPYLDKSTLLESLLTLSNGKHEIDYGKWINSIDFDSISQHQQWQWVRIKQLQKMPYEKELSKLITKKTSTMFGGVHWGDDNYSWYSNDIATTIIAFNVIKNDVSNKNMIPNIIQYFLEKRKRGYWINTVESASILSTILPEILAGNNNFASPATINISGDTSFSITHFPFILSTKNKNINNLQISKTGGGFVYFTAYQKFFNTQPVAVKSNFIIDNYFIQNGEKVTKIKTGEKTKMVVKINALKDAEFIMLQVPIPAGCLYANKSNSSASGYREYFKDKVALFFESLPKGEHYVEIELEARYAGVYTINPTKVELMYFPTFFGRNEMKSVKMIEE